MSKIGKLAIKIPEGVKVNFAGRAIEISGPKGSLSYDLPEGIKVEEKEGKLTVLGEGVVSAIYGTTRAEIANIVEGVSLGWKREMELVGTGYRGEVSGDSLILTVGYSHPVKIPAPKGITFKVEKTLITIEGPDKELVGQTSAKIRAVRPPEPYQGKGIKYKDEVIRRKAGKAAKTVGGASSV